MTNVTSPKLQLNDGNQIPQIGYGVMFLPDLIAPETIGHAIRSGYRHIDTAHAYKNEPGVGRAVKEADVPRKDLFVTTKLWNLDHGYDQALRAFDNSIARLDLDYLDLYLIHWPVPMEDKYVQTWKALIRLRDEGRIKSIGVCNFNQDHVERLISETGIVPAVNQIELHPRFQQNSIRPFHDAQGITTECWSPLGQGQVLDDNRLLTIAAKHGKSPSQIVLRWHIEQGSIVIPRSRTPKHIKENLDLFGYALDADDKAAIASMDCAAGRIGALPTERAAVPLPTWDWEKTDRLT